MSETATLFVGTYSRKEFFVDGQGKGVYAFQFDLLTGALTPLGLQAETGINPAFVCGTKTTLYVINECDEPLKGAETAATDGAIAASSSLQETGYVSALRIGENGHDLTLLNQWETCGSFPCHVSVNPDEDFLTVSNYGGGSVAVFPINADGSLAPMSDLQQFSGASLVVPDRQDGAHMHSTTWVPHTNFAFSADLGNDRVVQFKLQKEAKKLVSNSAFATRPGGSGPRHMAIHTGLNVAYVLDELSSTIGVHTYDAASGTLSATAIQDISTIPEDFTDVSMPADIHLSTCGNFVYASNRGHDSITAYRINHGHEDEADRGKLTLLEIVSTRGKAPRNFLIFRNFLFAANQDTNTIELFHIDAISGKLVFTGTSVECPTPVSLFIPPQYYVEK
uniref:6-phosphogluconolactonase n=1 Tax=Globisporangium ultimum (strain ATCC 200006 / CBS 805.95 / DAOM BR144) TaxID=431595 RepID=K3WIR0_GLOUD